MKQKLLSKGDKMTKRKTMIGAEEEGTTFEKAFIDFKCRTDNSEKKCTEDAGKAAVSLDPWRHRAISMFCTTCMWFVFKKVTTGKPEYLGRCRRHCPTMSGYPVVFGTDWCGDHKLDENKI